MTFEETVSAAVETSVRRAVAPLEQEIARLRAAVEQRGVTEQEAAERLSVSVRTIQRRISKGELSATGTGRGRRVLLVDHMPEPARVLSIARAVQSE
jgi:excisionase family DNA binding protein